MAEKYKGKGDKSGWVAAIVVSILLVGTLTGLIAWNLSGLNVPTTTPPDVITGEQVDMFMSLYHVVDEGAPAATPVNLYKNVGGEWVFWQTASSSSGRVTFTTKGISGTQYAYQVKVTAPSAAGYVTYITPLRTFTCPKGDVNGDADITDSVGIYETSTSAATFGVTDQDNNVINTEATQYVNSTDLSLNILVSITTNCAYGTPEDFDDMGSGYHYLAGVFFVLKCTASQPIKNAVAHFYSSSLHWYVFRIPMIVYSTASGYTTGRTFTIDTGTDSFVASADFDFDLYDTCKALSIGEIDENSFMNGDSDLNPTALANKVV